MARLAVQPVFDLSAVPNEIQTALDRVSRELEELRQRDELLLSSFRRLEEQLLLASQVQRDLLPTPLPAIEGLRVQALYLPADHVSGDIYDVVRVDETHAAVSVADAAGHGLPAALLTVFIKRGFRAKEIYDGRYRILSTNEVLDRLNRDLLETHLPDCRFITATHALYDQRARTLTWSRAGAPYPILVRRGQPQLVPSRGILLGTLEDIACEPAQVTLEPGDRIYFHTDGLEALLTAPHPDFGPARLCDTEWYLGLGRTPITDALAQIAERRARMPADNPRLDDITVVALEAV